MNKQAAFLLVLGVLSMGGDLLHQPRLKGIGALSAASPAPKVFSSALGLETFSTRFDIEYQDIQGQKHTVALTSARYHQVRGPYNRRNIYGAVLAFGPVLAANPKTQKMLASVLQYALCGKRPLLEELGIDPKTVAGSVYVRVIPLPDAQPVELPLLLDSSCP